MSIKTACPQCQANFELDDRLAGKTVRCQKCQGTFKVPEPPAAAESPLALDELPPMPAGEVSVATMAGAPPAEREEEIIAGKLAERTDSKPAPLPRSRRPAPMPTGNTGTGAIIAVIAVGLLACLLLAGGGGAAVFFLAIKPRPPRDGNRFDVNKDRPVKEIDGKKAWDFDKDDKGKWDWDDGKKWDDKGRFDGKKDGAFDKDKGWKDEPKKKDGKKDAEKKFTRIEDLPADERVFWQGIKFNDGDNVPSRIISPLPALERRPNGTYFAENDSVGNGQVSAYYIDLDKDKRVNMAMNSHAVTHIQIHDGDGVVANGFCGANRPNILVATFVPRKTGRHAIFLTARDGAISRLKIEIAFPKKLPVEVAFENSNMFVDTYSITVEDSIYPYMNKPSLGLCREYNVDVQVGYTYEFQVNAVGKRKSFPIVRLEFPNHKKELVGQYPTGSYRPAISGKFLIYVADRSGDFCDYRLEITRKKNDAE